MFLLRNLYFESFSPDDILGLSIENFLFKGFVMIFGDIDLNFFTFLFDVFSGYNSKSK